MMKIEDCIWAVDEFGLPVPPKILLSDKMMESIEMDAIKQLVNVGGLQGCVGALGMPDIHVGDGLPIGGVAAFRMDTGVITPAAVGFDINCGVRLLRTDMLVKDIPDVNAVISKLYETIHSGIGPGFALCLGDKHNRKPLDEVFLEGPSALVRKGFGTAADVSVCEEGGCMKNASVSTLSERVYERGRSQVGTLGGGNHFIEIQRVENIYDPEVAKKFGLFEGQAVIMIHSGSRGAGHQICDDHIKLCREAMQKYGIVIRNPSHLTKDLTPVPINSPEGQAYLGAMGAGANFAWANRHVMGHFIREVMEKMLGTKVTTVYDVTHNIAKREQHRVDGELLDLLVTRKGATRAFPAGHPEIPGVYQNTGHPVLIPGSMGTSSYVLVGTQKAMDLTFGSVNHGAGRLMSRNATKKTLIGKTSTPEAAGTPELAGKALEAELAARGVICKSTSMEAVLDEAPAAYKDIDNVIDVVARTGIARKVARNVPVAVMKG